MSWGSKPVLPLYVSLSLKILISKFKLSIFANLKGETAFLSYKALLPPNGPGGTAPRVSALGAVETGPTLGRVTCKIVQEGVVTCSHGVQQ